MADIEAIARRIFEAYKTRMVSAVETADAAKSWEEWYKHDWHRIPGRDTFRIMAGASLEPIKATLDVGQEEQVMAPAPASQELQAKMNQYNPQVGEYRANTVTQEEQALRYDPIPKQMLLAGKR